MVMYRGISWGIEVHGVVHGRVVMYRGVRCGIEVYGCV